MTSDLFAIEYQQALNHLHQLQAVTTQQHTTAAVQSLLETAQLLVHVAWQWHLTPEPYAGAGAVHLALEQLTVQLSSATLSAAQLHLDLHQHSKG